MKTLKLCGKIFLSLFLFMSLGGAKEDTGSVQQPLLTTTTLANNCSVEHQKFNLEIMKFGRIAAITKSFEECVVQQVNSLYRKCKGDPFYKSDMATQIEKVIVVSRSTNNVHIRCKGGIGRASASSVKYGHLGDEKFKWSGWFSDVYDQLGRRVCNLDAGERPGTHNCRFGAYPWPYSQAAGTVWHEAMHTHGYTHGANKQEKAIKACGYKGDPSWNFQDNTMPYILGDCIDKVIDRSANVCGNIDDCASPNQLKIIETYNGASCACVTDPGENGIGILGLNDNQIIERAIHRNGDWIGQWHYDVSNTISAVGDFNGDRTTDFIITSKWGIGIVSFVDGQWVPLMVKSKGTRFGAWAYNKSDEISLVGDFNGDGRDDFVIKSKWGIGILTLQGDTLKPLMMQPTKARFGHWAYNKNDKIGPIGDFNGDTKADFIIRSQWGIGILTLQGDTLRPVMMQSKKTRFGDWAYNNSDKIGPVGEFNGDGKDDLVIRSGWGMAILKLSGNSFISVMAKPKGTRFGDWAFNKKDAIGPVGDFDGDLKDELIVRSKWGIAILKLKGDSLTHLMVKPRGSYFGEWTYNTKDVIGPVGDFSGDGRDDLVIRSRWGVGVLKLSGSTLVDVDLKPYKKLFGSWVLEAKDQIFAISNFDRQDRLNEILIQKKQ